MNSNYISVRSNSKELNQLQLIKALIERSPNATFCVGIEGQLLYVNEAMCKLTQYSRQELLSKTLADIEPSFELAQWSKCWQSLQQKERLNLTSRYKARSGKIIPVELIINSAQEDGDFCCIFAKQTIDDNLAPKVQECTTKLLETNQYLRQEVSQLKQSQNQLANSVSLLQSTLESTANGIVALSFTGEILSYNQKFIDMWQVPQGVILSKKCPHSLKFFENKVKDPETFRKAVWEAPIQDDSERYDILELLDGRTFAHHSKPQLLEGEIIGRVWSIWDISEFSLTIEALKQNENGFATLAEKTEAIIFIIRNSRLCYVNSATEAIAGYTKQELLTEKFNLSQLIVRLTPTQQNGYPQYQEMKLVTKNGDTRWLACSVGLLEFEGKPAELVTAIDITNCKNAEAEVKQALEQAKQVSELKERFVSMLCHQFRTPLNIVSFSADLLKRHISQWSEDKKLPYLAHIQVAVEQLDRLLEEIMTFSKLEVAKLSFEPTEIDLDQFCRDLVLQAQLASNDRPQIVLINNCDRQVYLDKKLLEPIITNLLSNATKYSPANSIVKLEVTQIDAEIAFQVTDCGIGIPEGDFTQLFEPFYRCSNVGKLPGTGLGLSMVKMLVEVHGGNISVVSQIGKGSTFTVVLPT
ncbi:PAS domain-containing sensor histidine kinase [Synechocystis sp. PCC 7509]|uniref:PAS domain-containing sensor histidine kinase n=1 Tax=Synechocystis sp. PCC 7509 TaxID=927677 RepID=UPI0002AB9F89|nr:PAS domain-containing sensor histidine kinase [Synechocystis sp. PCC 7509]